MIIKVATEAALRLLAYAAPSIPYPVIRPEISDRNVRRLERKTSKR